MRGGHGVLADRTRVDVDPGVHHGRRQCHSAKITCRIADIVERNRSVLHLVKHVAHVRLLDGFFVGLCDGSDSDGSRPRWLMRLGRHDQLVVYDKPKSRPCWLTAEAYAGLPATLVVRELRYTIRRRGYRTRLVTLATTLLDPAVYPAAEVAELYGRRWQVETNLRHVKQTLRMDVLRCQTIEGMQKELTMYGLVYNMVRLVMLGERWIPLFPELRPHLEAVFDPEVAGDVPIITKSRDPGVNWRTTFQKIIKQAGLTPWERLFQNLRASRETELAANYPLHVVTAGSATVPRSRPGITSA